VAETFVIKLKKDELDNVHSDMCNSQSILFVPCCLATSFANWYPHYFRSLQLPQRKR